LYFTPAQADADAAAAISAALAVGQPIGTAIYFTIDYDPGPSGDLSGITTYFQRLRTDFDSPSFVGAISGVLAADPYKIGIYGPGDALSKLVADPAVRPDYTWLDFARNRFTGENIHRLMNNDTSESPNTIICQHDLDSAQTPDFGQWGISTWSSAVDENFNTASNWDHDYAPTTVIDAVISASGSYIITSSQNNHVSGLNIQAAAAALAVTNGTFTVSGNLSNAGTIDVDSTLVVNGSTTGTGLISVDGAALLEIGGTANTNVLFSPYSTLVSYPNQSDYFLPSDINNAGQIVGTEDGFFGDRAFIYSNGTYTSFGDPSASPVGSFFVPYTRGLAINDSGQILGLYEYAPHGQNLRNVGFIRNGNNYTDIAYSSGGTFYSTYPVNINDAGQVVGNYSGPQQQGFIFSMGSILY
jgi:probable HAF family extracellular repeat protein